MARSPFYRMSGHFEYGERAIKESVRAKLRVLVKRTLRKYGYPPDKQARATETVLKQAELLADHWVK